jgi:hypothetical protein
VIANRGGERAIGIAFAAHADGVARQYYGAAGLVIRVTNLDEALRALEEIVNQGEDRHLRKR